MVDTETRPLYELIEAQGATLAAGVTVIWQALSPRVESYGLQFSTDAGMALDGSACPSVLPGQFRKQGWKSCTPEA